MYDNGTSYVAFSLRNVGGKDLVITKILIRGSPVPWSNVFYFRTKLELMGALKCPNETHSWRMFSYAEGEVGNFKRTDNTLTLNSGYTLILYIKNPPNLNVKDVGRSLVITISSVNSRYFFECTVKSAEQYR